MASDITLCEGEADVLSVIILQGLLPLKGYRLHTQSFTLTVPASGSQNVVKSTPDRSVHCIATPEGTTFILCIVEDAALNVTPKDLKEYQLPGLFMLKCFQ